MSPRWSSAHSARDLVDAKCGTKPLNSAPSIYLHSDNNQSLQARMAGGKITVTAYDPDGNADLDWNTFRLYVAGVDKTIPAVAVWNALTAEKMTSHIPSPLNNTETLELRVDPKKLMTEHNFFNIAWNGTWPVQLKVCDRKGPAGSRATTSTSGRSWTWSASSTTAAWHSPARMQTSDSRPPGATTAMPR